MVGILMVIGGTGIAKAESFKSGPFSTNVEYVSDYRLAKVSWTNTFRNYTDRVMEVRYQFKVSYLSSVPYNAHEFTYLGAIHRTRIQPGSTVDVSHVDYVPYSAIQNDWYSYCGWRWTVNFSSPLLDTR